MISINIDKARVIAHSIRRELRLKEFEPFDSIIMKQIPGTEALEAEKSREIIREKYANMQVSINNASTIHELKSSLGF